LSSLRCTHSIQRCDTVRLGTHLQCCRLRGELLVSEDWDLLAGRPPSRLTRMLQRLLCLGSSRSSGDSQGWMHQIAFELLLAFWASRGTIDFDPWRRLV